MLGEVVSESESKWIGFDSVPVVEQFCPSFALDASFFGGLTGVLRG